MYPRPTALSETVRQPRGRSRIRTARSSPQHASAAPETVRTTRVGSEVRDISALWGRLKTTSAAAVTRPALVGGCRTPDRLPQVPPRGCRVVGLASEVKRPGWTMVSPHCVAFLSEATAGRNSVTKAPRRLASTRTTAEARGKMLAGSSRQYQGAGQCGDEIGDSGENWFPEVSIETPEFKQVFGRQSPHRCTAAHLSARALPHSMFRAVLIAFHVLLGISPSGVAAFGCLTQNLDSLAEPHTLAHSELFLHPTILPCDLLCGHMLR